MTSTRLRTKNSGWWIAVLVVLLTVTDTLLIAHERERRITDARALALSEATLMASFVYEALATQSYQLIEHLFSEWGGAHPHVTRVALTTRDGTVIAEYSRTALARRPFVVVRGVDYGYRQTVELALTKDLANVDGRVIEYGVAIIVGSALLAVILTQLFLLAVRGRERALLDQMAYLDGLTGMANRRRFDETLGAEWRRALRSRKPLALIIVDIDHFKAYERRGRTWTRRRMSAPSGRQPRSVCAPAG